MRSQSFLMSLVLTALTLTPALSARAQDSITIPKSRLEELERKERELNKLKGDLDTSKQENERLKEQRAKLLAAPPPAPTITHVSPPLETLPPIKHDEIVSSLDLGNYYRADSVEADRRFRGQKFMLRGQIVGFEKPNFVRNYRVILQTPATDSKVVCDLLPPDGFSAVFVAENGTELVGLSGNARTVLAHVGENVTLKAQCKGWRKGVVTILGSDLMPAK